MSSPTSAMMTWAAWRPIPATSSRRSTTGRGAASSSPVWGSTLSRSGWPGTDPASSIPAWTVAAVPPPARRRTGPSGADSAPRAAPLARPTPRRWRPSPSAVIPGAAGPASPVGHWTLTAAPEKALAAAVARQGRVERGVRHQRAATTAARELVPADVGLGVAVSPCRQVSPPRLVVARARRGRGPARRSCDRSGPPSCRSVGTSGGWTPHRRQGPGRSSAPGSPLFTLPQLCSISTRCAGWPWTISQTMWGVMPLGISAGRSPRRSHRILVL